MSAVCDSLHEVASLIRELSGGLDELASALAEGRSAQRRTLGAVQSRGSLRALRRVA